MAHCGTVSTSKIRFIAKMIQFAVGKRPIIYRIISTFTNNVHENVRTSLSRSSMDSAKARKNHMSYLCNINKNHWNPGWKDVTQESGDILRHKWKTHVYFGYLWILFVDFTKTFFPVLDSLLFCFVSHDPHCFDQSQSSQYPKAVNLGKNKVAKPCQSNDS